MISHEYRVLPWHGSMLFLHIFYVKGWTVSLYTYIAVYIETLGILFYAYGDKLFGEELSGTIIDTTFYVILFGAFVGFSVFAFRAYELRERTGFFAELNTRQEMESWRTLLNDLPEPVILSQKGKITFCNSATSKFFGEEGGPNLTEQQVEVKLTLVASCTPQAAGHTSSLLDKIKNYTPFADGNDHSSHYFQYTLKGKIYKLEVKGVWIYQKNNDAIVEHIIHDISALEDLEYEKAQKHCFQVLVATASHDIRTPLNAIQGAIEMMAGNIMNKQSQDQLKMAQTAIKRLQLYVQGLAYLEHIETNSLQIDTNSFEVPKTVNEILEDFDVALRAKTLEVSVNSQSTVPFITSDKEKYEVILYHIVENAVKYTERGSIKIILKYYYGTNMLETQVKDTGIGIKPECVKDLFKLFEKQRSNQGKTYENELNPQGIGLGLYMARALAKELGGDLTVESEVDVGTTVTFSIKQHVPAGEGLEPIGETDTIIDIPNDKKDYHQIVPTIGVMNTSSLVMTEENKWASNFQDVSEREPLDQPFIMPRGKSGRVNTPKCKCNRILIVDDDPVSQIVLKSYLPHAKLGTDTAFNGKEAISAVQKRKEECHLCKGYSLILMDVNMPVMDGITAATVIMDMMKKGKIPIAHIVAVTAAAHLETKDVALKYRNIGFTKICMFDWFVY